MSNRKNNNSRRTVDTRKVFDPAEYENRTYRNEHHTSTIGAGIRRADTRRGGESRVVVWRWSTVEAPSKRFVMSLSEARSLKAFLDRELEVLAR